MKKRKQEKNKKLFGVGKTVGPVDDLEQYLRSDWWKRLFNSIYLKTDADVLDNQQITEREMALFTKILGLKSGDAILDLACGQGRHLMELGKSEAAYRLSGLDRSRYLIQRAKTICKRKKLAIDFREGDARKLPYVADSFDVVTILGNSFGYFETSEDDIKVLKEIFRVLKPGGKLLMDVADGRFLRENFAPRSWEWIDKKYFVCRERSLAADKMRLISREVVTHTQKGVVVDQFYAERLYDKQSLLDLMSEVGFSQSIFYDNLELEQGSNQDLGMMSNRIVLIATADKQWTPKSAVQDTKNVMVILGDPNLCDVVKPDARFDTDDFYTIEQLKKALGEIAGYNFIYFNNHSSLIADCARMKGNVDLVLNLCDEGFGNDAKKELHIPSLLEMLGLAYTGSNPQTLAYCYDKSLIRGIASEIDVPVADAFMITAQDNLYELNISFPVIAKPNFGDSSYGITQKNVANNVEELVNAILRIKEQFNYENPILVEEFLTGAEVTVGIIGNADNNTVLPIIEEDYSLLPKGLPRICGYEAKWLEDSPYMKSLRSIRACLDLETEQQLIRDSLKLFRRLGCRDYCRFDWRLNADGQPKLLEANPNPGWCWDGHLAKMSKFAGISYKQMLEMILKAAEERYGQTAMP